MLDAVTCVMTVAVLFGLLLKGSIDMSDPRIRLNGMQKRAYNLIDKLDDLLDKYELEISFDDHCAVLSDRKTRQRIAVLHDDGFEIEQVESEDH